MSNAFRKILLLAAGLFAVPSIGGMLKPGDKAPDISTQASLGGKTFLFSLKDALRKGTVVVYFYPSAFTTGCNIEAHEFAEKIEKFAAAGASVIGVSLDSIGRLNEFSSDPKYCAGKVPVASDTNGKIAEAFGVKVNPVKGNFKDTRGIEVEHGLAERVTFVVKSDSKIAAVISGVMAADHVDRALAEVQKLAPQKKAAVK